MERNNVHNIDEFIAGYFSGNLSNEESEELKAWINASDENRKQFRTMKEIWFSCNNSNDRRFDKDKAYQRFSVHIEKTNERAGRKNHWRILWQSAAAVILLAIVSYTSFMQGGKQMHDKLTDIKIEAPWGSQVKTYLPDGTLVWLNAGSKLTYSQGFGMNDRKVDLSGEAYFEVTRNEKLAFSVNTEELAVNVLGTKFNFRNYPEDAETAVSLLEGKVLINNCIKKDENMLLAPDEKAILDKKSGNMRLVKVNAKNTAEWTNGYLFFDEELFFDIAKELERSYDVKIILTNPDLKQLRFFSHFVRKESSINEVMDILSSTGKIKYSINGKEIRVDMK